MTRLKYSLLLPLIATLINCTATGLGDESLEQRRQNVLTMRQEVLAELYELKPDTRVQIDSAAGYAVFTNANVNLILASFGGGLGVVRDNDTGVETFMRMGEVGVGLGAGIKDLERFLYSMTAQHSSAFWTSASQLVDKLTPRQKQAIWELQLAAKLS